MNTLAPYIEEYDAMQQLQTLDDDRFVSQAVYGNPDAEKEIVILTQHEADIENLITVVPQLKEILYKNGALQDVFRQYIQLENDLGSKLVAKAVSVILRDEFRIQDLGIKITMLNVELAARSFFDPVRIEEKSLRDAIDYTGRESIKEAFSYIHKRTVKIIREAIQRSDIWLDVHTMAHRQPELESFSQSGGTGFYAEQSGNLETYIHSYTQSTGALRPEIDLIVGFDEATLLSQSRPPGEIEADSVFFEMLRENLKKKFSVKKNEPYYLHEGHQIAAYYQKQRVGMVADISKAILVENSDAIDLIDPIFSAERVYNVARLFADTIAEYAKQM